MTKAVVVVDVQNDFAHPDGGLYVAGAEDAISRINHLVGLADNVAYTQDWHPEDSTHFEQWPVHCVENTWGSEFHEDLWITDSPAVIRKGVNPGEDGYSGFYVEHADGSKEKTSLDDWLRTWGVHELWIVGIALDVCVRATVLDALDLGYSVVLPLGTSVAVDPDAVNDVLDELHAAGAEVV